MIKLNKKGTSLVELIISIALISIVLIFMFRLLIDLNNEKTNNNFAVDNQIIRSEIIRFIENDLNNHVLTDYNSVGSTEDALHIYFTFSDGSKSQLDASTLNGDYYLEYTIFDQTGVRTDKRRWTLSNCTLYLNKANVYISKDNNVDEVNNIYTLNIDIEIHTFNEENTIGNNNLIDDILITYIGNLDTFNPNISCLGADCE